MAMLQNILLTYTLENPTVYIVFRLDDETQYQRYQQLLDSEALSNIEIEPMDSTAEAEGRLPQRLTLLAKVEDPEDLVFQLDSLPIDYFAIIDFPDKVGLGIFIGKAITGTGQDTYLVSDHGYFHMRGKLPRKLIDRLIQQIRD